MATLPIYLDNHATTPCDPVVFEAMRPYFLEHFGNAASTHSYGEAASAAVEESRAIIAGLLRIDPEEIIFTSGATESNNLAILGTARRLSSDSHFITTAIEHTSVLEPFRKLEKEGRHVTILPVRQRGDALAGCLDVERFRSALRPNTRFVSIMAANNEIGSIQPIEEIAQICRERGIWLHVDAAQALGKIPFDLRKWDVDLVSLSAHKVYGPKGIGALVVRRRNPPIRIEPLVYGGGHERGLRSGTLNVPGIVGFAKAVQLAYERMNEENERLCYLRNLMFELLQEALGPSIQLNGPALHLLEHRLAGNLNVQFTGIEAQTLLLHIPEVALSAGSACDAFDPQPSHVLLALGLSEAEARCSLRVGIGRFNTEDEIRRATELICRAVRELSSFYRQ
ncbi:MAG TPA: cysteine desulfurase family protein [Thermogutta sp.]|nr:cysteine desulfurase family protein [Thermogutta sp.]HQF13274.1 cysteine desulfurase family protein [Thermogutta sp.]